MSSIRSLRLKALNLRNKLLASSRFRSAASAFWPTRFVARKRARDVFDIVAGFAYSQTLFACIELDLLSFVRKGPRSHGAIAQHCGLDYDGTRALLDAAVALELLECLTKEEYMLGALGAAVVGDEGIQMMIRHHAYFYRDMADPIAILKHRNSATAVAGYWPYADKSVSDEEMDKESVARYTQLMSASQPMICEQVHAAYNLKKHSHLVDVGGGNGAFLMSAAKEAPELKLTLFDRGPVAALAEQNLQNEGMRDRITVEGGDFKITSLPSGADIISLVRILHDHDDEVVLTLLQKVHAALPSGGTVLIAEPLADTAGAPRMGSVYFSFYLRAMGSGRPRRFNELKALLESAGFAAVQQEKTRIPMLASVVHAQAK